VLELQLQFQLITHSSHHFSLIDFPSEIATMGVCVRTRWCYQAKRAKVAKKPLALATSSLRLTPTPRMGRLSNTLEPSSEISMLQRHSDGIAEKVYSSIERDDPPKEDREDPTCTELHQPCRPHTDSSVIPESLRNIIRQNVWDITTQRNEIRHGYLNSDVISESRLAAIYYVSAGPTTNLEVIKYSSSPPHSHTSGTDLKETRLYSQDSPHPEISRLNWAWARAKARQQSRAIQVQRTNNHQFRSQGGLIVAMRKRMLRHHAVSLDLHCHVNKPMLPTSGLVREYAEAFKRWDQALAESIKGYVGDYGKRHWFISQFDGPCSVNEEKMSD